MKCNRCGAYMPYSPDTNHMYLCATCVFQKKQLELQQEIARNLQQPSSSSRYPKHQWSSDDLIGAFYFFFIFFVGGGIWVTAESMFGDTGFLGFVFSMFLGFCVLVGPGVLIEYLKHKSNQ